MGKHEAKQRPSKDAQPEDADKAVLAAEPDWDRMGEIADRLLSTPPDRQAVGKALAPKRGRKESKAGA